MIQGNFSPNDLLEIFHNFLKLCLLLNDLFEALKKKQWRKRFLKWLRRKKTKKRFRPKFRFRRNSLPKEFQIPKRRTRRSRVPTNLL